MRWNPLPAAAQDVLQYWFFAEDQLERLPDASTEFWWEKSSEVDADIRARFTETMRRIDLGEHDDWLEHPSGYVAMVIVLDQFSRNMFRGSPSMYRWDARAQALALRALDDDVEPQVSLVERRFLYMPLSHAEDLALQNLAIQRFRALVETAPPAKKGEYEDALYWAHAHQKIIARFGRFPHRNQILGRESLSEEVRFLTEPESSF